MRTGDLFQKPLSILTEEELNHLILDRAGSNVEYHLPEVIEELRYREQRRIADSMRKIVTAQAVIAGLAGVVALLVAATTLAELFK